MESRYHAYNSVWQMRADAWCRLEDAAGQLARLAASGKPTDARQATCADVLAQLIPVEPYWAFPGPALFTKLQKIFNSGNYAKFAIAVGYINHALTHETYRLGEAHLVDLDNDDILAADTVVMDYIEAARLRGEGLWRLITREILPNALAPLVAEFGLRFCFVFLMISALSFLGVGIQPPTADWGSMVRDNAALITFGDVTPLLPAGAIALLTVAVNFVVDWMLHRASGLKE